MENSKLINKDVINAIDWQLHSKGFKQDLEQLMKDHNVEDTLIKVEDVLKDTKEIKKDDNNS